MILLKNPRHGLLIQRESFTGLTIMVDHKLRDHGKKIGSISMGCLKEISAMASRDKKKIYLLLDSIYVVAIYIENTINFCR